MASIKVQKSRFALLKIEDDDSDDGQHEQTQAGKKNASQTNAQKKKNKKKKQQSQAEINELKHLAFGAPNRNPQSGPEHQHVNGAKAPTRQWDEWQKMDEEYAAESYEKDLQQALLLSKLETEQKKQQPKADQSQTNGHRGDSDSKESKKKKKKDKHAMSLEEFNRKADEKKTHDGLDHPPSPVSTKLPPTSSDKKFFESVESDVSRILRQEKMQEEYKKQYAAESVITAKYQEQVNKLEKEVEFLRATMKKQEEELKQVKKRNKQLCVILAQGEMKGKAEVLMQVDQLTEVKDELTEQVSELTAELEKERSKVHSFKAEIDKLKGSKHK